jgi:hypothetical protein
VDLGIFVYKVRPEVEEEEEEGKTHTGYCSYALEDK